MIRARACNVSMIAIAAALAVAPPAGAEVAPMETMSFDESLTLDPLGDATISIALSMTAQQYAIWQQKYGPNKALLKRDLGKLVSQYDTYNWDIQTNDMERRLTVKISAHGAVKHRGGGHYELDVPASWRGGDVRGNVIDYNYVEPMGVGVVGHHNVKVVLPAGARGIAQTTGESGQPVVRYSVRVARHGPMLGLLLPGGGAILLGAALIAWSLLRRRPGRVGTLQPLATVRPATPAAGSAA